MLALVIGWLLVAAGLHVVHGLAVRAGPWTASNPAPPSHALMWPAMAAVVVALSPLMIIGAFLGVFLPDPGPYE